MLDQLKKVREASYLMAVLTDEDKNSALETFTNLMEKRRDFLLQENKKDLEQQRGRIPDSLWSRLKLDDSKLKSLIQGTRQIAKLPNPVGQRQLHRQLDTGLVLERLTVPLGVIAVVFESRPDVIPQILTLVLKTGNAALLKGGSEAVHSNRAFMALVEEMNQTWSFFPEDWSVLLETRDEVQDLLQYDKYIDLVIPRGSTELVRKIKDSTKIPVLGHAEGVCHLYVHENADVRMAIKLALDSKTQYPAACNSIETLLVDAKIAPQFFSSFEKEANAAGIMLRACPLARKYLSGAVAAEELDWTTEFGDLRLSVKVVDDLEAAVRHINTFGSHHTDAIVTKNEFAAEIFLSGVDSASVFLNASTRFADGFRYGFGAEVGVSTEKVHARGPVGMEGLLTYKYRLRGEGQSVAEYSGERARAFRHRDLP